MKPGDKIISDLDGLEYEVVEFGPRDELQPLPGVKQLGNCAIVKNYKGEKQLLYEWEMEKI